MSSFSVLGICFESHGSSKASFLVLKDAEDFGHGLLLKGEGNGLVYCMDYLEKNIDWLEAKLKPLLKDHYILFDFPGQVELFFLHSSAKSVIMKLIKKLNLRLVAVHLIDAHLCSDPSKYVSALLLSLSTMLHMELPHINVLSKIDLIENYGKLAFNLDFYTDVQDLSYLQYHLDQDPRSAKYRKLTKELCEVIEDYSLVDFTTLDIQANNFLSTTIFVNNSEDYTNRKSYVLLTGQGKCGESSEANRQIFVEILVDVDDELKQEQFEKSAAGRAAKAQMAAVAKQSSNANRGEPTLKWQMG
ncbi:hypothetical protein QQ045_013249 [Rhodiola kirilowii]